MIQKELYRVGLDEATLSAFSKFDHYLLARVIFQQKDLYTVVSEKGTHSAKITGKMMYEAKDFSAYPAVGDWVAIEYGESISIIHAILPRKSMLERKSAGVTSVGQIIATNIDYVFICMSLNENYNLRRLERYLAVVFSSGAIPLVLLTKSDLTNDVESLFREAQICAPSVTILTSSSIESDGYEQVKNLMQKGKSYAFIGSSGVGKSTLVNALLGETIMETFDVGKMAKGRHITTSRSLFITPDEFIIIDTPGMRELQIDQADFTSAFADIETYAESCKFNDCTHTFEPHCAVLKAVEEGVLSFERLRNFQKMLKEAKHQEIKQMKASRDRAKARR